jgi:hypothetical protein
MGTSGSGHFDAFTVGCIVVMAAFVLVRLLMGISAKRKRQAAIMQFAQLHHLSYLGSSLPKGLAVQDLYNWRANDEIENLIWGSYHGDEVVVFDYYRRNGRRSSKRTMAGLRIGTESRQNLASAKCDSGPHTLGEWIVLSESDGLVAVQDLDEMLPGIIATLRRSRVEAQIVSPLREQ